MPRLTHSTVPTPRSLVLLHTSSQASGTSRGTGRETRDRSGSILRRRSGLTILIVLLVLVPSGISVGQLTPIGPIGPKTGTSQTGEEGAPRPAPKIDLPYKLPEEKKEEAEEEVPSVEVHPLQPVEIPYIFSKSPDMIPAPDPAW